MRTLVVLLIAAFTFSCKSAKKYTKYNTVSEVRALSVVDSIAGDIDTEIKIDVSTVEVEVTKYEPVYFKQNGKDTVVLKQVTYRKVNTVKTEEQTISVDTISTKSSSKVTSQQTEEIVATSQFKGYNIVKDVVSSVVQGFLTPFLKYAWVLGVLLAAPIINWIRRKISQKEPKN